MCRVTTAHDPRVARADVLRFRTAAAAAPDRDEVAVEEPLEIRVDGEPLAVTMRTPGDDEELAAGFLAGEGLIRGADDIESVGLLDDLAANVVEVTTARIASEVLQDPLSAGHGGREIRSEGPGEPSG
jgi:formate dehydrogenase accessory protein FdhD